MPVLIPSINYVAKLVSQIVSHRKSLVDSTILKTQPYQLFGSSTVVKCLRKLPDTQLLLSVTSWREHATAPQEHLDALSNIANKQIKEILK